MKSGGPNENVPDIRRMSPVSHPTLDGVVSTFQALPRNSLDASRAFYL